MIDIDYIHRKFLSRSAIQNMTLITKKSPFQSRACVIVEKIEYHEIREGQNCIDQYHTQHICHQATSRIAKRTTITNWPIAIRVVFHKSVSFIDPHNLQVDINILQFSGMYSSLKLVERLLSNVSSWRIGFNVFIRERDYFPNFQAISYSHRIEY